MDVIIYKKKYIEWINHKKQLEKELEFATKHIKHLENGIKEICNHDNITQHITYLWDGTSSDYICNECNMRLRNNEIKYENVKKRIRH